jgi:hypothetical protein
MQEPSKWDCRAFTPMYVCMCVYRPHLNSKKHMKVESNHNRCEKNDSEENDDTFDTERVAKIKRHGLG